MLENPTYEQLRDENALLREQNRRKDERIAYLERMLYASKSDRLRRSLPDDQPGLFDDQFREAMDEKADRIEKAAEQIEKAAASRRASSGKGKPSRPEKYNYHGLEERTTVVMPDGVEPESCDIIGKDVTRILHREPARLWVEVIERPILRDKADRLAPSPRIHQAPAPPAAIGGNHAGADLLSQIVIDKYRYHLPEYRQAKQYADMGLRLPTSTINGWVHAVASRLDPLYEALRRDIRETSDYLQVDEVPWRIADVSGGSRKGYACSSWTAGHADTGSTFSMSAAPARGRSPELSSVTSEGPYRRTATEFTITSNFRTA